MESVYESYVAQQMKKVMSPKAGMYPAKTKDTIFYRTKATVCAKAGYCYEKRRAYSNSGY